MKAAQSEPDPLKWNVVANLRWLADQSDRPNYMPCGMLTGMFLLQIADRIEGHAAAITQAEARGWERGLREAAAVSRGMGTNYDSNAGERYAAAITALIPGEPA